MAVTIRARSPFDSSSLRSSSAQGRLFGPLVNTRAFGMTHIRLVIGAARKEKADHVSMISLYLCRQRPTLPHTFACSNIGPAGLNYRVRDGNGWIPRGMITDNLRRLRGV